MSKKEKTYFFDKKRNINLVLYSFCALCAALFAVDFFVDRHSYHRFEEFPVFYAAFGFLAYVTLVVVSALLRKLVMRPEDYYTKREGGDD